MGIYIETHVRKIVAIADGEEEGWAQELPETGVALKIDVSNVFSYLQEL